MALPPLTRGSASIIYSQAPAWEQGENRYKIYTYKKNSVD